MFVNVTTKSAQHAHARMIAIIVEKSPNSSHMYDHGFMDNTNRQAVKTDLIHRQEMRPLRHGGSHFVNLQNVNLQNGCLHDVRDVLFLLSTVLLLTTAVDHGTGTLPLSWRSKQVKVYRQLRVWLALCVLTWPKSNPFFTSSRDVYSVIDNMLFLRKHYCYIIVELKPLNH